MELDKRIKEGKRPLTCFDTEQAKEFLGKECYFSNCKVHYKNLSAFEEFVSLTDYCIGTLTAIMDLGDRVFDVDQQCKEFRYCLPCEWVKPEEPEKKYRPYTKHEFLNKFECGKPISIRRKDDCINLFIETIPSVKIDNLSDDVHVRLFEGIFNLKRLFDEFEWQKSNGEWQPFGVEIQGEE